MSSKRKTEARRRYTDEFRASAVVMMTSLGWPDREGVAQQVSDHLNVPRQTLTLWAKRSISPPPTDIVHEKAGDLSSLIESEIQLIFGEMPNARETASYSQLATAFGILFDKLSLLRGLPTQHVEVSTDSARERILSRVSEYSERNAEAGDNLLADGR